MSYLHFLFNKYFCKIKILGDIKLQTKGCELLADPVYSHPVGMLVRYKGVVSH